MSSLLNDNGIHVKNIQNQKALKKLFPQSMKIGTQENEWIFSTWSIPRVPWQLIYFCKKLAKSCSIDVQTYCVCFLRRANKSIESEVDLGVFSSESLLYNPLLATLFCFLANFDSWMSIEIGRIAKTKIYMLWDALLKCAILLLKVGNPIGSW